MAYVELEAEGENAEPITVWVNAAHVVAVVEQESGVYLLTSPGVLYRLEASVPVKRLLEALEMARE